MLFYFAFVVILGSFCSNLKVCGTQNCVVPKNWNGSSVDCHQLQFYVENKEHYFVKNSTFNFLPGEHRLGCNLTVENVAGLKLQAATDEEWGQITQDLPIVNCSGKYGGFVFSNVSDLEIHGIYFTECGQMYFNKTDTYNRHTYIDIWNATLVLKLVTNFIMINVSITESNGYGILGDHVFNSSMTGCLLEGNKGNKIFYGDNTTVEVHGGNIELYYNRSCQNYTSYFDITDTTMRAGKSVSFASGLDLILNCPIGGINIRLNNVTLSKNSGYADNFGYHEGGNFGLQILLSRNAQNSVTLVDCTIEHGHSYLGSGMYVAAYIQSQVLDHYNALEIKGTNFFNNTARIGAGIHMRLYYSGDSAFTINITLNSCRFEGNKLVTDKLRLSGGIAVNIINYKIQENQLHLTPQYRTSFINCTFDNNVIRNHTSVGSGTLYFEEHPNVVFKNCTIRDNNSTGITAVHSNIHFIGENTIENNTAMSGGGLLLSDHATILLSENSTLNISNNTAITNGGGIYAEFGYTYAIPICFFQFDVNILLDKTRWNSTRVYLDNNNASTGTAVYGGQIDKCYFLVDNEPQRVKKISHLWSGEIFNNTFKYTSSQTRKDISSDPVNVCFCKNNTPVCNASIEKFISPGETFTVHAAVVGQRQGNVSGSVRADFYHQNWHVSISLNETIQPVHMNCTNLTYTLHSERENIKVNLSLRVSASSNLDENLHIHITECPMGFRLNNKSMKCECVPELLAKGIKCNERYHTIHRPANFWIGYTMHSTMSDQVVINKHCPRMYCKPYETNIRAHNDFIEQDFQCYLEREGLLCGRCRQHRSIVFGTPRCHICHHFSIWATFGVLSFCVLAGLVLVAFLFVCNITVTEGTLNGFIFCGNLIQANQEIYFPLDPTTHYDSYEFMRVFIAWLNLDIGAETCFFNGMDTLDKTLLQFVFPIYIWCIAGLLIWLSRKYSYMTRLMKNNGTKVLATLILLSYTKIGRAVMTSLSGTPLSTLDHPYTVWYFDGTVPYFSGRHVLLFLTAVVFGIILLPFTIILLLIKHLPRFSSVWIFSWVNKLKPFFDAYTGPYTDEFRFWMGFQLLIRIGLLFCTGFHPPDFILLMEIIGVCALLLSANYFYGTRIYKKRSLNCLEAFLLFNLICWSMAIAYRPVKIIVFPGIIFLAFCGVVGYHTYKLYIRKLYIRSCGRCLNKVTSMIINTPHTEEEADENMSEQTHLLPNIEDL